mgnify:FL=1
MASMVCPSCNAPTNRLIYPPVRRGDDPIVCCESCRYKVSHTKRDRKLYTGKKFWVEEEVYTRDQVKEKNHEFEKGVKQQVADQYKHMRPSTRKRLYGE